VTLPHESMPGADPEVFVATRQRLHGIGECLMAGPQRRAGGRFTLRVTPGGFATTGAPALRLDGTDLVVEEDRRVPVMGTFADVADATGVDFGRPPDPYPGGSNVSSEDDVSLHLASAVLIQDWFVLGDAALRVLAPRETPILWPEHFDVAILVDDTSIGVCAGDDFHPTPYAYVGNSSVSESSSESGSSESGSSESGSSESHADRADFWNAPFGALRDHNQMRTLEDLVIFWRAAQDLIARSGN
jgi:hypothetical protein